MDSYTNIHILSPAVRILKTDVLCSAGTPNIVKTSKRRRPAFTITSYISGSHHINGEIICFPYGLLFGNSMDISSSDQWQRHFFTITASEFMNHASLMCISSSDQIEGDITGLPCFQQQHGNLSIHPTQAASF